MANKIARSVRVSDRLWGKAKAKAEANEETISAVITRALVAYVGEAAQDDL